MQLGDLSLGFVTGRSAHLGREIYVDAGVGRLLEIWAQRCRRVTAAMSESPERQAFHDHPLNIARSDFLSLPWLPSVARGFHKAWACRRVIREVERRSDIVIVQLPFAAPLALLAPRRPRVYHVCANIWAMARHSAVYSGYKRMPALMAGETIDRIQRRLVRRDDARLVSNGAELLARYGAKRGRAVVSSAIHEREIMSVPRRRPGDAPLRILFVGHLRHAKGIDTLLAAYEHVLNELPSAELVLIGPKDLVDHGMSGLLSDAFERSSRKGTVRTLGHIDFGPELFQCFADADVLCLPSRSEGTPRVLVEARAFGCPVIGASVGGIPTSIQDELDGLLVPPNDPAALSSAILRIARDRPLRERLVAGGLARARQSTVEAFAQAIAGEVAELAKDLPAKAS